jgi:NAD(P)-dependent dehydrogenase (short-subunit alcohol dehydrogenase family)
MRRKLKDAVIVVTGASSGIGRETALQLAREGARLVIAARREDPLETLQQECEQAGAQCLVVPTDVSVEDEVNTLAARAVQRFGRIDGWVNNAGVYALGSLEQTPLHVYRRVMDVNYFGVVHGTRAAAAHMKSQPHGGVIVNVSSEAGSISPALASAYTASKHAVRGFTSAVRQEFLKTPVELSNVMPAGIDTPLFEHAANFSGMEAKAPAPVYPPEKVARVILKMLVKPEAEIYVGTVGPVMGAFRHAMPAAFDRVMRKQSLMGHFKKTPQGATEGNLYHPVAAGASVHGGYLGRTRQWARRIAVFTTLGFGAYRLLRVARQSA